MRCELLPFVQRGVHRLQGGLVSLPAMTRTTKWKIVTAWTIFSALPRGPPHGWDVMCYVSQRISLRVSSLVLCFASRTPQRLQTRSSGVDRSVYFFLRDILPRRFDGTSTLPTALITDHRENSSDGILDQAICALSRRRYTSTLFEGIRASFRPFQSLHARYSEVASVLQLDR